ncbi:hypothetical protein AN643_03245 [Candidatus Epulonipiscioides saccharophilum]|nr:hypothetical protein AN643_03245 [Epulopiscium sp. SCG-B10WGA-EpuloB]
MSLLNKCQKQIALAIIASSGLAIPAELIAAQDVAQEIPNSISAIMADLNLITGSEKTVTEVLDKILKKSIAILELDTSSIGGLDLEPNTLFIEANNPNLIKLKNLLEIDGNFASGGASNVIATFATTLEALNDTLYSPDLDADGKITTASDAVKNSSAIGQDYLTQIQKLQKLIHIVDAHLDLSSLPDLNYENILYGENKHHIYGGLNLDGALKFVYVPENLATNYPVADLIWPASGKPDHIKLAVRNSSDLIGDPFVDENDLFGLSSFPYELESDNSLGSINLTNYPLLSTFDGSKNLYQAIVEYIILDEQTGKRNQLNLALRYIASVEPISLTQSMSRAITSDVTIEGDLSILDATTAVPIYVSSANGADLFSNQHWVAPQIFDALNDSLNEAVEIIMNVYKDTKISTEDFEDKFKASVEVTFLDTSIPNGESPYENLAALPDEKQYDNPDLTITGTAENHSTMEDLTQAFDNLINSYESYIAWAKNQTGTADLIGDIEKANLPLEIAKAMLGLKIVSAPIPTNPMNPFDFQMNDGYGLMSPVYLYVRKATADDVASGEMSALDSTATANLGEYILAQKDTAENILAYDPNSQMPTLDGLDEDEDYFIGPVICDDPYLVGKEELEILKNGTTSNEMVTMEITTKYITTAEAKEYLNQLAPLANELEKYNGTDPNGNKLHGNQYSIELQTGSAEVNNVTLILNVQFHS